MTFYSKFPAECNSERILKNGPTLLKYPPEYAAYFFEPPCIRILLTHNSHYFLPQGGGGILIRRP